MLDEQTLNALPERIAQRLEKVNALYLQTIGEDIKKIGTLTATDRHRLQQMKKTGGSVRKITAELERISAVNEREIREIFDIVAADNVQFSEQFLGEDYIPYERNEELQRLVKALADQAVEDYRNMSRNTAFMQYKNGIKTFTPLSERYSEIIDEAITAVTTGQSDFYSAMRRTLRETADLGLRTKLNPRTGSAGKTVDYANGYSRRLDTAVRQNLLWGMKQCNLGIQEQVGQTYGADGYEIDYHPFPRPSHEDMGGRQYINAPQGTFIDGAYFPPFADVEYLLHDYGCLHFKWPIICGVSEPAHSEAELAELKANDKKLIGFEGKQYTRYELSQIQRQLETAIRHAKDRQILAKAAGDDVLRRREQAKINALTEKYKKVSIAANLPIKKQRMSLSGYHRVKVYDKDLPKAKNRDTITKEPDVSKLTDPTFMKLHETLKNIGVDYLPIKPLSKQKTESDIINTISGGDHTEGSCASAGLAYIGQKSGFNVLDFRDGESRRFFSTTTNLQALQKLPDVVSFGYSKYKSSVANGVRLLEQCELGKEYYFVNGKHAAIVKKIEKDDVNKSTGEVVGTKTAFQYLELQSPRENGWKNFGDDARDELRWRFGETKSDDILERTFMIDIDSVKKSKELQSLLGYINTAEDKQVKGHGGSIK